MPCVAVVKARAQKLVLSLVSVVYVATAVGYFVAPSRMSRVAGITRDPTRDFLIRSVGVALLALAPGVWAARHRDATAAQRAVLVGVVAYLLLSSLLDLAAYRNELVGAAAIPSIAARVVLAGVTAWLIPAEQ